MSDLSKISHAMERASLAGETVPSDVLSALLPEPVLFGGFRIGPVSVGHVLALARVGNPLAYSLVSRSVDEQTLADRLVTDIEAFYLLTMPAPLALRVVRSPQYRDELDSFVSALPVGFLRSGYESAVLAATAASLQAYLPMEAVGEGARGKRRSLVIWPFWLIRSLFTGVIRYLRR